MRFKCGHAKSEKNTHIGSDGKSSLNNELIAAKGWHLVDVMECITEIGKAQREGVRIIVPR